MKAPQQYLVLQRSHSLLQVQLEPLVGLREKFIHRLGQTLVVLLVHLLALTSLQSQTRHTDELNGPDEAGSLCTTLQDFSLTAADKESFIIPVFKRTKKYRLRFIVLWSEQHFFFFYIWLKGDRFERLTNLSKTNLWKGMKK